MIGWIARILGMILLFMTPMVYFSEGLTFNIIIIPSIGIFAIYAGWKMDKFYYGEDEE